MDNFYYPFYPILQFHLLFFCSDALVDIQFSYTLHHFIVKFTVLEYD